jgi:hypothetical protein
MRHGSRTMLMPLASQSERMATVASPAPRKTAFTRNRSRIETFPPSIHAA